MMGWSAVEKFTKSDGHRLALLAVAAQTKLTAQLTAAPSPTLPPSPIANRQSPIANGTNAFIQPRTLAALALTTVVLWFASLYLTGCGTPVGIATANLLESPTNQAIINFAVDAGVNSLVASVGGKIPTQAQAPLTAAASSVVASVSSGVIYSIAQALRTKQGTTQAAIPASLTQAATYIGGAPADIAPAIATAVQTLAGQGVPADAANEAVAATLDATAKAAQAQVDADLQSALLELRNQPTHIESHERSISLQQRDARLSAVRGNTSGLHDVSGSSADDQSGTRSTGGVGDERSEYGVAEQEAALYLLLRLPRSPQFWLTSYTALGFNGADEWPDDVDEETAAVRRSSAASCSSSAKG